MKSIKTDGRPVLGSLLREALGAALPLGIAAGLFLALPVDSRSQADAGRRRPKPEEAVLCGEWHRAGGETVALDLERVKRSYLDLGTRLAKSLDARGPVLGSGIDPGRPYDAGLPACREEATRTVAVPAEKGGRLRGRTLVFLSAEDPARVELPPELEKEKALEILVVRARSLSDLPRIARRLGRPVGLGTAELARALGVRCATTWARVTEKGDAIVLHESR